MYPLVFRISKQNTVFGSKSITIGLLMFSIDNIFCAKVVTKTIDNFKLTIYEIGIHTSTAKIT